MGLSLLLGVIGYLIIIFFLAIWLTKYHTDYYRSLKEDESEREEDDVRSKINLKRGILAENSRTTPPSGNQSFSKDDKGGV